MRIRTGYSFRTAVGHLPDIIERLKEIKWKAAPISDRTSAFGFNRWSKLCAKHELRPIYGVELAVVSSLGEKRPSPDYWTFFAKDSLRSIHELIALATANPGREPSLLYKQALAAQGVIKIAGERLQLERVKKKDKDLYVALSPSTPIGLYKQAKAAGFRFIASGDNVFPRQADLELYRVALGKRAGTQTYPQWIIDDDEWMEAVWFASERDKAAAIKARDNAIKQCRAELRKATLLKPERKKTLRQLCIEGAKKRSINLKDKVYAERLDRELKLIADKKFEDYFYILSDIVGWARDRMAVGPARGSSCGSLVCYLLDITTVDPIPYGLIFERFIDINRADLPDIDVDFSDKQREEVFKYIAEKYGEERMARLGTVMMYGPKSALQQAGISLRIPKWKVDKALDGIIERSSGDSRAMQQLEDTLKETINGQSLLNEFPEAMMASRMEGHPTTSSQHAAGVLVTDEPILEYVAVDSRTNAAMCDKKDAEDLNLLKIDALGLTQLSIFERALELIGEEGNFRFFDRLPLDDAAAFNVLSQHRFAGVFQFAGQALQSLVKQIEVTHLEDIISITALARPGPMATGGAGSWVRRKLGKEPISSYHPMLTELTKETLGITIYQEQVMKIVREMGGMSWEDTSAIRKAMSGRLGNEFFERYWLKFKDGALKNGIDEDTARLVWDQINTFGSWAFNRSHAVAYGLVSYYCCWLKAHYPVEFAAATLDAESDPAKQIALLRELKEEGIDYLAFDPDHSTDKWMPIKKGERTILVGPLTSIKGIGSATVREIMEARSSGTPLRATLKKRLDNAKTDIDTLFPIADKVKELHPDLGAINIVTAPTPVIDVQADGAFKDVVIIGVASKIAPKDENEAVNVMKRGYAVNGPTAALNLFIKDDTDMIFCKVSRYDFERIGRQIVEQGRVGKSLYAIKGSVPPDFRMIKIKAVKYLGEIDG